MSRKISIKCRTKAQWHLAEETLKEEVHLILREADLRPFLPAILREAIFSGQTSFGA